MLKKDWQKTKKSIRKLINDLNKNGYFVDCDYLPCKVTKVRCRKHLTKNNTRFFDVDGISLVVDGGTSSCSLFSCNPEPITEKEAFERAEFLKNNTKEAYYERFYGS